MKFSSFEERGIVRIAFDGAMLGGPEATALNEELHRLMESGKKQVVIDLSKVSLMNSSGLGMLISCYTTVMHAQGELKLAGVNDNIRSLIIMTKLHTVFHIFSTVEDAIADF